MVGPSTSSEVQKYSLTFTIQLDQAVDNAPTLASVQIVFVANLDDVTVTDVSAAATTTNTLWS